MASEHPGERSVSLNLPESLNRWLDDKAAEEDLSREDVLLQLVTAYRQLDGSREGALAADGELSVEPAGPPVENLVAELRDDIESVVEDRLQEHEVERGSIEDAVETYLEDHLEEYLDETTTTGAVDEEIEAVESRFMALLQDVRERVVQVKRETDSKAPADHEHPELLSEAEVAEFEAELSELSGTVEALDSQMADGFENFEQVLAYLTDSIDELAARQTTLARALVETRDELRKLGARDSGRAVAEDLKRTANRNGITKATCDECSTPVNIGLLSRPECPHCSSTFVDVKPASGFFGSSRLETGRQPALEPSDDVENQEGYEYGVDEIIESESPAASGIPDDADDADDEEQ